MRTGADCAKKCDELDGLSRYPAWFGVSCKDVISVPRKRRQSSVARLVHRLRRPQVVWLSLLGAMTGGGGLLLALDRSPAPRADGIALAAPIRVPSAPAIESVLNTRRPLDKTSWKRIVIHHSGSAFGSPDTLAQQALASNLRGLGYHFVIGNGSGSGDGELYVGYRWLDQLPGAHATGPEAEWHNEHSIGICLVGDGERKPFSPAQMRRLGDLVATLAREFGLSADDVVLHRQIAPVKSPGRLFSEAELRGRLSAGRGSTGRTGDVMSGAAGIPSLAAGSGSGASSVR